MASFSVPCSKCDARVRVLAETVGKRVRCPECREIFEVPPRRKSDSSARTKKQKKAPSARKRRSPLYYVVSLSCAAPVILVLIWLLVPAIGKVREAATVKSRGESLKQIALAMHNYADTYGHLPSSAIHAKDGKPLLSWRVMILPYIEQQELYKEFHLDESWDSEHNKQLLAKMPKVYAGPDSQAVKNHETYYQAFVGPGTAFEGKEPVRFADISDGTSHTILVVEASKAVPWTKPEDVSYDPAQPPPPIGLPGFSGFCAVFCDGSTLYFEHRKIQPQTLRYAITRNDGEKAGLEKLGRLTDPNIQRKTITFEEK